MPEQVERPMLGPDKLLGAEMLSLLFQELTGRMPNAHELMDAHQRLWTRSMPPTSELME